MRKVQDLTIASVSYLQIQTYFYYKIVSIVINDLSNSLNNSNGG